MQNPLLINVSELAAAISVKPKTIRNRLCTTPNLLPPVVRLPGQRSPLFRLCDVQEWINSHVEAPKRRVGRPTKAEQAGGAR